MIVSPEVKIDEQLSIADKQHFSLLKTTNLV
jgi:hypothetical protein